MAFKELDTEWDEVLIIDILSNDERKKYKISSDLLDLLARNGVEQLQMNCSIKRHVFEALQLALSRTNTKSFVIHFIAHGNKDGIGNNENIELIKWQELKEPLLKINKSLNGELVVNMIACKGISALKIDDFVHETTPYYALIGPKIDLPYDQAHDITQKFYRKLLDNTLIPTAVKEINEELQNPILWAETSQTRRGNTMSLKGA
jgi:hypothetical protein